VADSDLEKFINSLRNRKFDDETCFLCSGHLPELGSSEEHIVPRWVQNRYDLWNQKLILRNGTDIPYRYLTVPCCEACNNYRLQPIETSVSEAVSKGPEAVRKLGNRVLFLWLGKIVYGILYKELFLSSDRKDQYAPSITEPELMRVYGDHLFFLQEARGKVETMNFCPGSIFVFRTQKPENVQLQWDLVDHIDTLFIGVRLGEVGIIAVLGDGGALQLYQDIYASILDLPLHPIQFRELCAVIAYQSTLATRTPKYATLEGNPHKTYQLPLGGLSLEPLFEEWDTDVYAFYLAHYTGFPLEVLHPCPDEIMSFVYDPDGKPRYMPYENK
jgi:hypothetical protein